MDISRRDLLKGATMLAAAYASHRGIDSILGSGQAYAQEAGEKRIQVYDPLNDRIVTDSNVIQRLNAQFQSLLAQGETLEDVVRVTFRSFGLDSVLGVTSNGGANPIDKIYFRAPNWSDRLDVGDFIRNILPPVNGLAPIPLKIKTLKVDDGSGSTNDFALVWDEYTQIHLIDLNKVNQNRLAYAGNYTRFLENFLGFWPSDIVSVNNVNDGRRHDKTAYFKRTDGTWAEYSWDRIFDQLRQGIQLIPTQGRERFSLEDRFSNPGLYAPDSIFALNDGNATDYLVALQTMRTNSIPLQAANYIRTFNQSRDPPEVIYRWELPVQVYVHSSVDIRNVEEAMRYWHLVTGINYVVRPLLREVRNLNEFTEEGILVRTGTDSELNGGLARGGITDIYPNGRARKGKMLIQQEGASYIPFNRTLAGVYRHELGHALGFLGHDDTGVMQPFNGPSTFLATRNQVNEFRWRHRLNHGSSVNPNGTISQLL